MGATSSISDRAKIKEKRQESTCLSGRYRRQERNKPQEGPSERIHTTPLHEVSGKWNCVLARTESHVQNSNEGGIHEGTLKVHNLAKVASTVTDNTTPAHNNVDQQDLILIACMASKRGDIAALEDLAERVDLKGHDAFGRNALYYACLCGHLHAVHFIVIHAFGGVEGILQDELWECRKNALTDDVRRYLDTGNLTPEPLPEKHIRDRPRSKLPGHGLHPSRISYNATMGVGYDDTRQKLCSAEEGIDCALKPPAEGSYYMSAASLYQQADDNGDY